MSLTAKVIVADDHRIVRESLVSMINNHQGFEVVAQAGDGFQALELAKQMHPDLMLVDISMPGLNGIATVQKLAQMEKPPRILVLTMHEEEEYVLHLVKAGAHGFLLKDSSSEELLKAISTIHAGRNYFGDHASQILAEQYRNPTAEPGDPYRDLTIREKEVFHLIVDGMTTKEVASKLNISVKTAENHRGHILEKLGCRNIAELVRYAAQKRLI